MTATNRVSGKLVTPLFVFIIAAFPASASAQATEEEKGTDNSCCLTTY